MLYDAKQLAEMYKVSDVTIYAKLKLKQLAPYLVTKDRKRYVTEGALPVFDGLLNPVQSVKHEPSPKPENTYTEREYENLNELVKSLKEQNALLISQLEKKDRQIEIDQQSVLNMQYLMKDKQKAIEAPKESKPNLIQRLLGKKKDPDQGVL